MTPRTGNTVQRYLDLLGLQTNPQLFAIVEAYTTEEIQEVLKLDVADNAWVNPVIEACKEARILNNRHEFDDLLNVVEAHSQVHAVPRRASGEPNAAGAGRLLLRYGQQAPLTTLAIPTSSNSKAWYLPDQGPVEVYPATRFDPRRQPIKVDAGAGAAIQRAVKKANSWAMAFGTSYSRAGSGFHL